MKCQGGPTAKKWFWTHKSRYVPPSLCRRATNEDLRPKRASWVKAKINWPDAAGKSLGSAIMKRLGNRLARDDHNSLTKGKNSRVSSSLVFCLKAYNGIRACQNLYRACKHKIIKRIISKDKHVYTFQLMDFFQRLLHNSSWIRA